MRNLSRMLAMCAALIAAWPTQGAQACTAPNCLRAVAFPNGGTVPTDQFRVIFYPAGEFPRSGTFDAGMIMPRMYRLEGSTKVAVAFDMQASGIDTFILKPIVQQPVGAQVVLETDVTACAVDQPLHLTYSITEARPLPKTLGTLGATVKRTTMPIAVDYGTCSDPADVAYADLALTLSAEAQPFADILKYTMFVDDAPHASFTDQTASNYLLPQGKDRIFTLCGELDARVNGVGGLGPGVHKVRYVAQIGDNDPIATDEISVELRCEGVSMNGMDAGAGGGVSVDKEKDGCSLTGDGKARATWFMVMLIGLLLRRAHVRRKAARQ